MPLSFLPGSRLKVQSELQLVRRSRPVLQLKWKEGCAVTKQVAKHQMEIFQLDTINEDPQGRNGT